MVWRPIGREQLASRPPNMEWRWPSDSTRRHVAAIFGHVPIWDPFCGSSRAMAPSAGIMVLAVGTNRDLREIPGRRSASGSKRVRRELKIKEPLGAAQEPSCNTPSTSRQGMASHDGVPHGDLRPGGPVPWARLSVEWPCQGCTTCRMTTRAPPPSPIIIAYHRGLRRCLGYPGVR